MSSLQRRLARLEDKALAAHRPENEFERKKRMEAVREFAGRENERFFLELATEQRKAFLESAGYEGHTSDDLRDENFIYADDEPPFRVSEDGEVFCTRDGRPVIEAHQTLAEVWYWDYVAWGNPGRLIHDEQGEGFYMPNGELAFSRERCYLPRYLWTIGDTHADPCCIVVPERLDISKLRLGERSRRGEG